MLNFIGSENSWTLSSSIGFVVSRGSEPVRRKVHKASATWWRSFHLAVNTVDLLLRHGSSSPPVHCLWIYKKQNSKAHVSAKKQQQHQDDGELGTKRKKNNFFLCFIEHSMKFVHFSLSFSPSLLALEWTTNICRDCFVLWMEMN